MPPSVRASTVNVVAATARYAVPWIVSDAASNASPSGSAGDTLIIARSS